MAEYAPPAIRACFETIRAGIPGAILSGIVGDRAHTYGYHRGRNYVGSGDYSRQRADDKKGNGEAASALDISLNHADMKRVTQRLIDATMAGDARVQTVREFFGTVNGRTVTGLDVRDKRWVTSDPSHLWHVHLSFYRAFADDHAALQRVAAVITGGGTTQPPTPAPEKDWFDMATQKDLETAVRKVLNEATPQGQTSWAESYRNYVYKVAHDLTHGSNNITTPRMDTKTGAPSMSAPMKLGNVIAWLDYRVTDILARVTRIEGKIK